MTKGFGDTGAGNKVIEKQTKLVEECMRCETAVSSRKIIMTANMSAFEQ